MKFLYVHFHAIHGYINNLYIIFEDFNLSLQDQNESAAILKIKETMQEEAKRFEKDVPPDHPDYFMP